MRTNLLSGIIGVAALAASLTISGSEGPTTSVQAKTAIELVAQAGRSSECGTVLCTARVFGVRGRKDIAPTIEVVIAAPDPVSGMMSMASRWCSLRACSEPISISVGGSDWWWKSDILLTGATVDVLAQTGAITITPPELIRSGK